MVSLGSMERKSKESLQLNGVEITRTIQEMYVAFTFEGICEDSHFFYFKVKDPVAGPSTIASVPDSANNAMDVDVKPKIIKTEEDPSLEKEKVKKEKKEKKDKKDKKRKHSPEADDGDVSMAVSASGAGETAEEKAERKRIKAEKKAAKLAAAGNDSGSEKETKKKKRPKTE